MSRASLQMGKSVDLHLLELGPRHDQ